MQIKGLYSAVHLLNPTLSAHIATSVATSAKLFNPPANSSTREAGLTRVGFISCWGWFWKAEAEKASKSWIYFNPSHRILLVGFVASRYTILSLRLLACPISRRDARRLFNSPSGVSSSIGRPMTECLVTLLLTAV